MSSRWFLIYSQVSFPPHPSVPQCGGALLRFKIAAFQSRHSRFPVNLSRFPVETFKISCKSRDSTSPHPFPEPPVPQPQLLRNCGGKSDNVSAKALSSRHFCRYTPQVHMTTSQISKKVCKKSCISIFISTSIYIYTIFSASDPKHQQEAFSTSIKELYCAAKISCVQTVFIQSKS